MKKLRRWFQTDLGYAATKQKLLNNRYLLAADAQDYYGRLSFQFKNFKDVTYQITTHGKVGIFYPENLDPKHAFEKLKPYLVKADGSKAEIISRIKEKPSTERPSRFKSLFAVISLAVTFLLIIILIPPAINQIITANTTSWDLGTKIVYTALLPAIFIICLAVWFSDLFQKIRKELAMIIKNTWHF